MKRILKLSGFISIVGAVVFSLLPVCLAAQSAKSVAVSRFVMQAPEDMSYLQRGVQNLLVSRLTLPGKTVALPLDEVVKLPVTPGLELDETSRSELKSRLGTDYLLVGSITGIGKSVSIDGWLYNLTAGGPPQKYTAQGLSLDDVIPQINLMASNITSAISGLATAGQNNAAIAQAAAESQKPASPLDVLINPLLEGQNISYLNPNFIEITPEEVLQNLGVWRSQTLREGILGMDVGDLNGDGRQEIVTASYERVSVFVRQGAGLKTIATHEASKMQRFIWCSLKDVDGDGAAEIIVSAMKKKNLTVGGMYDSMAQALSEFSTPSSLILKWDGGNLVELEKDIPYFLNVLDLEGERILLGQKANPHGGFDDKIYEMQWQNDRLNPSRTIDVPTKYCNVFNFTMVDVDSNGSKEYVVILPDNRLAIVGSNGQLMWKSRHRFGATTNYILGKVSDARYNAIDYYYIPTPIIVTDLNGDGIKEIVANRSPDYSRFLPAGFKYYESGQVVSLSWDQVGLIENWATRELGGMVTSIRLADTDSNGVPELLVSVVLGKDLVAIWKTETVMFAYDLNLKKAKR
ncbi:FG-GAP repeat domain-containing protein [Thermodesulforhabdus norvegica]|uniref:Repeat domain-containing protein n=1 Tax=Thermodesulforhabdus norvegica TaxID=39841 RepID=A0A1I4V7N7_9BACT|nr:VCBS repeat-containing protein [Thermodesulforhabdus norvegica]SFM97194.1 Repeat domain-containing protein [Thermodesulforhabdus norvegica]